jgi:hypothetical protein
VIAEQHVYSVGTAVMITGHLTGSCEAGPLEYKVTSAELGRVLVELLYRSASLHQLDFQGEFCLSDKYFKAMVVGEVDLSIRIRWILIIAPLPD